MAIFGVGGECSVPLCKGKLFYPLMLLLFVCVCVYIYIYKYKHLSSVL